MYNWGLRYETKKMYQSDDELLDTSRQETFSKLREQIGIMLDFTGPEDTFLNQDFDLNKVNIDHVDEYITQIESKKDLPQTLLRVRRARVGDKNTFLHLCNYIDVHNVPFDPTLKNRIYFLETNDYEIVLIPIETEKESIRIHIEPFNTLNPDTPWFLKELYQKIIKKHSIDDIKFEDPKKLTRYKKGLGK